MVLPEVPTFILLIVATLDRPSASIGALKQPDEEWDVIAEEEAAESRNARIPRGPVVIGRVGEKGSSRIIYLRQFVNKENSK